MSTVARAPAVSNLAGMDRTERPVAQMVAAAAIITLGVRAQYCPSCGNEVSGKAFCDCCGQRTGS